MKQEVVVVIGAGGIGMAIARRQGFGKHILLADFNEKLLESAAKELELASYKVSTLKVDVSSRASVRALADAAAALGSVVNVVNTAGVSPNMAPPDRVLAVDLVWQCRRLRGVRTRHCSGRRRVDHFEYGWAYVGGSSCGAGA